MQNQYNLLYREEEREITPLQGDGRRPGPLGATVPGVSHLARRPKAFGASERSALEKGADSEAMISASGSTGSDESDLAIVKRAMEIPDEKRWPMGHVALAWILRRVASPIIGFSSVQRMDEAIAAMGKMLSTGEEESLEALYRPKAYLVAESL
jgi:aryl-alcohol dehydrogenase-like predicted oxidoreductase